MLLWQALQQNLLCLCILGQHGAIEIGLLLIIIISDIEGEETRN